MQDRNDDTELGKRFGDRAAGAASDDILFDRHQIIVRLRQPFDQLDVDRLDEAHVSYHRVDFLTGGKRGMQHAAESEYRDALRPALGLASQLALADRQRAHLVLDGGARPRSARIAYRARCIERERGVEHLTALV